MDAVLYEVRGTVATITLNRPDRLNAIVPELTAGLRDALANVRADPAVRAVVLTGAGRAFCAGADLSQAPAASDDGTIPGVEVMAGAVKDLYQVPVPTLARVQGVAAGGGIGLALVCDLVVAARSASFVCTFGPRLGIVPDVGTTWHLSRLLGRARAFGVAMLGDPITADQAESWGMIWQAVEDDQLDTTVGALSARLARCSPTAFSRIRATLDAAVDNPLTTQVALEFDHNAALIEANMAEGAAAFLEKREPDFPTSAGTEDHHRRGTTVAECPPPRAGPAQRPRWSRAWLAWVGWA